MNNHPDSDLLQKAAAAMRAERTGHNAGSGFTRARILNDVRAQRRKRSRWWRIGFPVGIILAGTTAWASASGKWPEVWVNMSTILNLPLTDNGASERSLATANTSNPARPRNSAPVDDGSSSRDSANQQPVVSPELTAAQPPAVEPTPDLRSPAGAVEKHRHDAEASSHASTRSRRQQRAARNAVAQREVSGSASTTTELPPLPPPPELEAEIRAFRRADDLYRRSGDLPRAVGAYRQYVRDYPTGRFVPEAKYNTALSLLKLGRASEARPLLLPFAEGAYGAYHREAAQKLLEALGR
jgi:TolA-binding protein